MPERIQRSRRKGWTIPTGAVYVGRPTKWGNSYRIGDPHPETGAPMTRRDVVALFRLDVEDRLKFDVSLVERLADLRGHDLVCWCPVGLPCHADVLLEVANR